MMNNSNSLNTPNGRERQRRVKLYFGVNQGTYKDTNINHYKNYKDLDMQIYGNWLEAINLCAIRCQNIPTEILDDFYYVHKEEE